MWFLFDLLEFKGEILCLLGMLQQLVVKMTVGFIQLAHCLVDFWYGLVQKHDLFLSLLLLNYQIVYFVELDVV